MFNGRVRIFLLRGLLSGFLFGTIGAQAQAQESRFLQPTASLYGSTGYWKVLVPDTVPPGQASFSVWYDRIGRNPGFLTISTVGIGGAVGITKRLEFGVNFEINRRVLVRRQNQLSFGQQQLGFFGAKVPGSPPLPGELMPGSTIMPQLRFPPSPFGTLTGAAGFYNMLPFASRNKGNGVGTVGVGFKLNILSESTGSPLGLGARVYANIPTHRSASFLLVRPTQTGDWQYGLDLLASKNIGDIAALNFNLGFMEVQDPGKIVDLANVIPLSFGFTLPRNTRIQYMQEVNAYLFAGGTPNTSFGAEDPADVTVGFRAFLSRYLSLSAGYRAPLSQFGGDKNGFVVNLAYNYGPPLVVAAPTPPTLSCSADPPEVLAGESVRLAAQGVSSTGAMLTYEWSTTAGTIEGSGPAVQLRTANLQPGGYTATVRATEAPGLFADCTTRVTVRTPPPPPPQPPTVTCSVDRPSVQRGEVVTLTATARSPQNRPLTYQWTPSAGQVQGTGATVRFDTTNLQPGTYTVRVRVTDDANQSAECSMMVTVTAPPPPPPPPQASKLDECLFNLNSGRVDNVCKAKLDNVALRLQSEADATLVIVGLAESTERNAQRLAQTRADNTKAYLTREKGIADSRVSTRTGSTAARGREQRKTELHLVPRGATFTGQNVIPEVRPANENAAIRQAPSGTQPSVTRTTTPSRSPSKPGTTARNSGVAPKDNRYPGRAVLARAR